MNYVRSNSLSLKYQGFPPSDSQDIGIRKFEFVTKSQFLCLTFYKIVNKAPGLAWLGLRSVSGLMVSGICPTVDLK